MAKPPANHGKQWTPADVKQLKQLAKENTPTRVIGLKMGRTPDAVAHETVSMLTDPQRSARIRQGLARVRSRLGGPGGSVRAAKAILRTIEGT